MLLVALCPLWLKAQIGFAMPFVLDPAHEQGAIERNRTLRKQRLVLEEAGMDLLDLQGLDLPAPTTQLQALKAGRIGSCRVAQRAPLEEDRGFFQGAKHGSRRQLV